MPWEKEKISDFKTLQSQETLLREAADSDQPKVIRSLYYHIEQQKKEIEEFLLQHMVIDPNATKEYLYDKTHFESPEHYKRFK